MTLPSAAPRAPADLPLTVERVGFGDIPRHSWDALLANTAAATPFARWTFHRAWWDAHGAGAREHYLLVSRAGVDGEGLLAIVPFMARTEAHPSSPGTATRTTLFMAASYHADYATVLGQPDDLPAVLAAVCRRLADPEPGDPDWDSLDLRRLRTGDPVREHLGTALETTAAEHAWQVLEQVEDVCPVVDLAPGWDAQLARLGKKARHEIRRKVRRAERLGPVALRYLPLSADSVERFIRLHQSRWGSAGLFPPGEPGDRSRAFLHRLVELERAESGERALHMGEVTVADRVIYMLVGMEAAGTCYFYNAGMDPEALDLSPGVVGTAVYLQDRIAAGDRRFDFLRGDEGYKYQWGAVDEPVHRFLVQRVRPSGSSSREGAGPGAG